MKNSKLVTGFGVNVRARREEMGISQEELAFRSKVHRTAITHLERGTRASTLVTVEKIAKALGVQPGDLMPKIKL